MNGLKRLTLLLAGVFLSTPALAYYSVMDNGEIMEARHYKLTPELQFITDVGGINTSVRFDTGLTDDTGLRAMVGFGRTDFFAGALFKWMPVPDFDKQPAIGANFGVLYGRENNGSDLTFRLEPLVSKRFLVHFGHLTPYASLPLGLRIHNGDRYDTTNTDITSQIVVGTQVELDGWDTLQFMTELGADLASAYSHISLAAVLYFDEEHGFLLPSSR